MRLSSATVTNVDWDRIDDASAGVAGHRSSRSKGEKRQGPSKTDVARVFQIAKEEFNKASEPLRRTMRIAIWCTVPCLALMVAGSIGVQFYGNVVGGVVALGGLGSTVVLLRKAWELHRDQWLLELVPTKYELALSLATSQQQFATILDQLLVELSTLRGN